MAIPEMAINLMFAKIELVLSPLDTLRILARSENPMAWCGVMGGDVRVIRFKAYGIWLHRYNIDWFNYLKEINDFAGALMHGALKSIPDKEPEGWINPVPYFDGKGD